MIVLGCRLRNEEQTGGGCGGISANHFATGTGEREKIAAVARETLFSG